MKYKKYLDSLIRIRNVAPADSSLIRMHAGERTESFADSFFKAFIDTLDQRDFIEYPNVDPLRERLAKKHGVKPSNIFISPGSDFTLAALFHAFIEPSTTALMPEARFPMYDVYVAQCQGNVQEIKYTLVDGNHKLNIDGVSCDDQDVRIVVVGNPNSPVGDVLSIEDFTKLERYGCPIVVDQAYGEFGKTELPISLINKNYVFVNTFSKAFGAAGARVGYAVANEQIIELIGKFRLMFEVTGASAKFASYLLDNEWVLDEYVTKIVAERERLKQIGTCVNFGGWVHLNHRYNSIQDKYIVKPSVRLPLVDEPLIRMNIFEGLSDELKRAGD